ncbi:MAG TPA: c-type cytochrome biogenesis protein CcmI [Casimicrobiaceae bacterium]|nr:c-type cytochrome biogenesis protein CcmI [Casimicrobiaceae bacterium]
MTSTPIFWLIAFVLALVVLAALVWPLLRSRKSDAPGIEAAATAVFRDHKRQLDEEVAAGTLSPAERDAAEAELVKRFGDELAVESAEIGAQSERSRWIVALVLVAVVPASAALLYYTLGEPGAIKAQPPVAAAGATPEHSATDPQIIAMIDRLAEKMKASPEDPKGWILLGRSYLKLGRYKESVAAFEEAAKRMPPDTQLFADMAEAVAMAQGQSLQGRPEELIKRSLALDPNNPQAIGMAAAAAAERRDFAGAIVLMKRLKDIVPPNSEESQQVDRMLAELEAQQKGGTATAAAPGAAPPAVSAPAPATPAASAAAVAAAPAPKSAAPKAEAESPKASGASAGVTGRVEIDPKLAGKFAPGDALFIYARDPEGSRMPLAIVRGTAAELPKAFTLTDAMAMTPAATISNAKSVVIEARISKSGNAAPSAGDLRGTSSAIKPGAGNVRVVIDQVVP